MSADAQLERLALLVAEEVLRAIYGDDYKFTKQTIGTTGRLNS
jgi:hypothetical protein